MEVRLVVTVEVESVNGRPIHETNMPVVKGLTKDAVHEELMRSEEHGFTHWVSEQLAFHVVGVAVEEDRT